MVKIMKNFKMIISVLAAAALLSSCNAAPAAATEAAPAETTAAAPETTAAETESAVEEELPEAAKNADLFVSFKGGESSVFEKSHGWSNGDPFNVTWKKQNVTFNDGNMQLVIDKDPAATKIPYAGGEYRSLDFYGYGRYEVSMKAIKNDGVVSSFFTYTGPSDSNPWDEIDVEILGKDTTQVQFNYYTDGRGGHEYMHELGFDASEDFHTYAFEWTADKIVWYVDGVEVHTAEKKLPVTPGKIMMNAWCGKGVDGWLNAFTDDNIPLTAEYEWLAYTAF